MNLRLRFSLLVRMAFAVAVLTSLSVVLGLITVVVCSVVLGLTVPGILAYVHDVVEQAPRLSTAASVPPPAVAVVALAWLAAVSHGWERVAPYTTNDYVIPPSGPVQLFVVCSSLVALYLAVVESVISLGLAAAALFAQSWGIWVFLASVVVISILWFVLALRSEVRTLRERSVDGDSRAASPNDRVVAVVRRLSQQAGVSTPEVRISSHDRPVAFTIGSGSGATIVVSDALLTLLSPTELEAVLAHEVSHLVNGDSRVMTLALAPVVYAADFVEDDPDGLTDLFWWLFNRGLFMYGQLGVAVLSRGREWAADAGAAALTGSPTALASALARLDEARGTPGQDLRAWSDALVALDVLPTLSPDGTLRGWAFQTHPSTEARIDRLQRLAAEMERE